MSDASPRRIGLSRRAGFDLHVFSRFTNGLPARAIARPGRWGNPFPTGTQVTPAMAVERYRLLVTGTTPPTPSWGCMQAQRRALRQVQQNLPQLAGHNLACWCAAGEPCHGDVLLRLVAERCGAR